MKAVSLIILFHLINIYYVLLIDGENSGLITHCQWYNRYDFDVGVIFNCNNSENEVESTKSNRNGEIYFNDADGIECFSIDKSRQRYCNKHMIDAIQFKGCSLHHIPYTTFRAYPFIRLLDISRLGLASLQPEHLQQGAKRSWDLFAQNNELREIPAFLFINAGSVVRVDLSYNKIKRIDPQGFIGANDLSSLDLSGNKIEIISEHALRGLVNLTHMNLAHNQITEIHSFAFVGLNRLYHLDISHNLISVLEDRTFANLSRLNRLQLSYNQIYLIKPYAFATALSLSRLDLSHNNITDEQIFENLYNLLHLDLSHNPINELGIGTFAKLVKLEHLDMGHTNLTDIELGTFSYSRGLISLDLSENNLKTLDFGLFLPAFRYMESLYLDGNKLSDMEGFSNSLFPRLNALGITNNNFNCTYLKQFMRSVDWEQIRLPVDRMPLNIHKTNIRGVECDTVESNVSSMEANVVSQPDNEQSNMVTAELNHAIETVIRHLPAVNAVSDSDMKIIKLPRTNGSHPNVMILVW